MKCKKHKPEQIVKIVARPQASFKLPGPFSGRQRETCDDSLDARQKRRRPCYRSRLLGCAPLNVHLWAVSCQHPRIKNPAGRLGPRGQ